MKTNHNAIDALDEMLRLAVLEPSTTLSTDDQWIEQLAENVFSAQPLISPEDKQSQELLARLQRELEKPETFGELLSSGLQRQNNDLAALAAAANLSSETLAQLTRDTLFPNRVPLIMMKRLIDFTGISLEKAKAALRSTAGLIIESPNTKDIPSSALVFARRRSLGKIGKERITGIGADDFMPPHFAQSSLEVYLQRLETLFEPNNGEKDHE